MHRKLYNSIQSHIILLLLLHVYTGVTSLIPHVLMSDGGGLVPASTTPEQAEVHSGPLEVATSEQLSLSNFPQAIPPPAAATLTTNNDNAVKTTDLPGNAVSVPAARPGQLTALDPVVNSDNVAPVRSSQASIVPQQSTTHPPERSNDVPDATNLLPAPSKTEPVTNSREATSPSLPAASEDGALLGTPRTSKTSLLPTSERALAVPGTDQSSIPPTMIPKTAPAILKVLGSAHNTQPASQSIRKDRSLSSTDTARDSGAISSINNGTSGQKFSTTANRTENMTTLSRPSLIVSSTLSVANTTANVTAPTRPSLVVSSSSIGINRTTVSTESTTGSQITLKSSASLFSGDTTATAPATTRSSSSADGLRFEGARSHLRDLEMIRLFGYLTMCMMIGARILV